MTGTMGELFFLLNVEILDCPEKPDTFENVLPQE
jgi:hypothetical protein